MKTKDITAWIIVGIYVAIVTAIGFAMDLHYSGIY
jgi:hypothetical protein